MKQILKQLLVVAALGSISLQAMQSSITTIETTEPKTDVILTATAIEPPMGGARYTSAGTRWTPRPSLEFEFASFTSAKKSIPRVQFLMFPEPGKKLMQPPLTFTEKEKVHVIVTAPEKFDIEFTSAEIQNFDPTNRSGEWALKIEGEKVSFEKP
jgi:hypothetical protein